MAARERSLRVTDMYRKRLLALRASGTQVVARDWGLVSGDDIDAGFALWVRRTTPALSALQSAGANLSSAYLSAYLGSELAKTVAPPPVARDRFVGVSRTGKPLAEAFDSVPIVAKKAISAGADVTTALATARSVAIRLAATETLHSARAALADSFTADDRIAGWSRVTSGGCGACLAAATRTYGPDEPLLVHDNCRCAAEPIVSGAPDRFRRPDGNDIFQALTITQQDELLGPDKAEVIRAGAVPFSALVTTCPMNDTADQITEASLRDLHAHPHAQIPA
jgi:hypothetical protein